MMRPTCQDTISPRAARRGLLLVCATATLIAIQVSRSPSAHATSISIGFTTEFSGATPPVGVSPWLTATFDDEGTPGTVKLTLTATNLTGSEFVSGAYFNLNTSYSALTDFSISAPTKTGTFNDPTIDLGIDAFKADGDGLYDFRLNFAQGPPSGRFGVGDSVEYTVTGIGAAAGVLVADDFKFLSLPDGGHGPFYVAAHIQGIGPAGSASGWITAPEPASWLLALGMIAIAGRRRRS
jgi:hypothetical protein